MDSFFIYSHLSNKRGGWNKRGGGAKNANSLNVEVGINVEGVHLLGSLSLLEMKIEELDVLQK